MHAKGHVAVAAIFAILIAPIAGNAATVSERTGAILINQGKGFSPMGSESELPPGTHIMVQPGGSAVIAYAGNCTVRVGSGVWLVQAAPPCASGVTEIDFTGRMNQQGPPGDPPGPNLGDLTTGVLVVGGAIGVGILVGEAVGKESPSSP
jgi:hypothetical protein